jgi:F0F1-type ATP synthase membrane subunit c/vacuolar-type H+-ATPase subunit K
MRKITRTSGALIAALAVASAATVPALAQSSNLNSINNSLAEQGEMRALQQQQTTNFDQSLMQSERNQMYQQPGQNDYSMLPHMHGAHR